MFSKDQQVSTPCGVGRILEQGHPANQNCKKLHFEYIKVQLRDGGNCLWFASWEVFGVEKPCEHAKVVAIDSRNGGSL